MTAQTTDQPAAFPTPADGGVTLEEISGSLTGFDEIAIELAFDVDLFSMSTVRQTRAMVFTHARRNGLNDRTAYSHAMNMKIAELQDYFAPEPDEFDPSDPVTESGKDD